MPKKIDIATDLITREFGGWRNRVRGQLPVVCRRVFSLRETFHSKSALHWDLERRLGHIIKKLSDYEETSFFDPQCCLSSQVAMKHMVESFFQEVAVIEREVSAIEKANEQRRETAEASLPDESGIPHSNC